MQRGLELETTEQKQDQESRVELHLIQVVVVLLQTDRLSGTAMRTQSAAKPWTIPLELSLPRYWT